MGNKYLDGLNEEQTKAATSIDGAVRLIAGAGSGKTFTLTRRVAYICDCKKIHPSRVLSLTFTNKAAEEMRNRTATLMGLPESDFNMSTFHSLALDIVKEHCKEIFGWNDFRIGNMTPSMLVPKFFNENSHYLSGISDDDKEKIQKYLLKKLNILLRNNKYVKWLDNNSNTSISLSPIDKLLDYIDLDEEASKVYKKCKDTIKKTDDPSKIKELLEEYEQKKLPHDSDNPVTPWLMAIVQQKSGICTFDDLIHCALYLLENYPEIRDIWSNKFDYIQVDEFQDTDMQQLRIVQLLYERHGNLFVVGDPDQSIYLFRGAEPTLFNNLDDYIPNLRTIFMITNYRSSDEIVNISNKVIEMNKNRIQKNCVSKAGPNSNVELIFGDAVASLDVKELFEIKKLLADGVKPNEIVVLYRSSNDKTTYELQNHLKNEKIPFVTTFLERDIYYDIVYNLCRYKHCKDDSFLVNAAQHFEGNSNFGSDNLIDLSKFEKVSVDLNSIYSLFNSLKEKYKKAKGGVLVPTAEYQRFLNAESKVKKSIEKALEDWDKLSNEEKRDACVVNLLLSDAEPLDGNGIKIMTMHKSKGLEFPYVFVNGLSKSVMDKAQDNAEVCEEKARLAYVAYSRAKIKLYLGCDSISDMHGVLGQVCDLPYVDLENPNLSSELKDEKDKSISNFEDFLDRKTEIVYYKLIYNGETKGYRCVCSLHGERYAFHAKLEDLERLNCVPKRLAFVVKVGRDIQVAEYKNDHCYAFDELNKSMKVIDLVTDAEIKAVFVGSNNGYNKDIKDVLELDNIIIKHKNKPVVKKYADYTINKIKDDNNKEGTEDKIEKSSKPNYNYILLLSKNKNEVLGVRMVNGDKYKDISIEDAKKRGLMPKDCTQKKYISIKSDLTYDDFIELNKKNKEKTKRKYRITIVNFSENRCSVLEVQSGVEKVLYIDDVVNELKNQKIFISNPSSLINWKYWKE